MGADSRAVLLTVAADNEGRNVREVRWMGKSRCKVCGGKLDTVNPSGFKRVKKRCRNCGRVYRKRSRLWQLVMKTR